MCTRRRLLQRAATAVAAPWFVPASVLGAAGRPAPSERITLGCIGLGLKGGPAGHGAGNLLAEFAGNPACQVLALCDVDRRHLARSEAYLRQRHGNGGCATCTDA